MRLPVAGRKARGSGLLQGFVAVAMIGSVLTLTLDWGRRVMVDGELQAAADAAAALAAAQRLAEQPAPAASDVAFAATQTGNSNATSGGQLNVSAGDVAIGAWNRDARSFAPCDVDKADAVRVTVSRSSSRGNGIGSVLGRLLGFSSMSSSRSAIARVEGAPDYALVGLDGFTSQGVLTVDGSPWYRKGSIASNGDVKLNLLGLVGVTLVDGHIATLGSVRWPAIGLLTYVRDGVKRPDKPFELPAVSLDRIRLANDNAKIPSLLSADNDINVLVGARVPAGTYYCRNLNVLAGAVITCDGPVTVYVENDVTVLGTVLTLQNDPANCKVRVAGDGLVTVAANMTLSADVYAPGSTANIAAGVIYRGRLMARRINVLGTSLFFLRPDLPQPELGRSRVTLVK